jgi:hypothetical protein
MAYEAEGPTEEAVVAYLTPYFTITKINWLKLFKEITQVYNVNHTKTLQTKFRITDR